MKTLKVKVYEYKELNDDAKKKAREWYLEGGLNYPWHEFQVEDAKEFLESKGFIDPEIMFSGFCSQGDGACFSFKGIDIQKLKNDPKKERPELEVIFRKHFTKGLLEQVCPIAENLSIAGSHSGHYCHEFSVSVSCEFYGEGKGGDNAADVFSVAVRDFQRELSSHLYKSLEKEWDYLNSVVAVEESIESNGYTFTKDGKRFG
jgi:hypothetical protein